MTLATTSSKRKNDKGNYPSGGGYSGNSIKDFFDYLLD